MGNRRGVLARLMGLLRGWAGGWVRDREEQSPRAVFEHAIAERVRQYRELKEAVAGILYMRNKLEAELGNGRQEMARTLEDLRRAVRGGDDQTGLALVHHKRVLAEDIERAEREFQELSRQADEAKRNLLTFREEIRALEREKGRTLASLANARARRRMREALDGLSVDADMRALESVRAHLARLSTEGELDRELDQSADLSARIRAIREQASSEAARQELDELKCQLRPAPLPAALVARPLPAR